MSASLKQIHIELTNKCNLNCLMCYRREMSVAKGTMDRMLFKKLAVQIPSINTIEKVFLHWRGEPTCCEYLPEAVEYLCELGVNVILFTNGLELTDSIAERVLRSGIHAIYFSLESTDSNGYAILRGSNQYSELVKIINKTVAIRNKLNAKTKINISTVLFDNSLSRVKSFDDYWKRIVDGIEYHVDTRGSHFFKFQQKQCNWPNIGVFIAWNGLVSACCMDVNHMYPIGDVNHSDIIDVFNSDAVKLLRMQLNKGLPIGKCNMCNLFRNNLQPK